MSIAICELLLWHMASLSFPDLSCAGIGCRIVYALCTQAGPGSRCAAAHHKGHGENADAAADFMHFDAVQSTPRPEATRGLVAAASVAAADDQHPRPISPGNQSACSLKPKHDNARNRREQGHAWHQMYSGDTVREWLFSPSSPLRALDLSRGGRRQGEAGGAGAGRDAGQATFLAL